MRTFKEVFCFDSISDMREEIVSEGQKERWDCARGLRRSELLVTSKWGQLLVVDDDGRLILAPARTIGLSSDVAADDSDKEFTVPADVASTSTAALSVSTVQMTSPRATESPSFFSHSVIRQVSTELPSFGINI